MELIDKSELFNCDTCYHYKGGECNTYCDYGECYRLAANRLKPIDPVHVAGGVYCRECRYWFYSSIAVSSGICEKMSPGEYTLRTKPDDFCSRGSSKRRV